MGDGTRICKICGMEKPINQFETYITPIGKRTSRSQCKECRSKMQKERLKLRRLRICPICEKRKRPFDFVRENSLDYKAYGKICRECAYKKNLELRKPKRQKKKRTKKQIRENQQARYRKTKQWMIEQKGDKCAVCGKSFPWYAYDFHHEDSKDKESQISRYTRLSVGHLQKLPVFKDEFKKCILVCAICHRSLHLKGGENMAKSRREVRDGTGPYRGSFQRQQFGGIGKRRQAGQICPKKRK